MFPIRCYDCNKVLGHLWETYRQLRKDGITAFDALAQLQIPPTRICCRRMFVTHVEIIDKQLMYNSMRHDPPRKKRRLHQA